MGHAEGKRRNGRVVGDFAEVGNKGGGKKMHTAFKNQNFFIPKEKFLLKSVLEKKTKRLKKSS